MFSVFAASSMTKSSLDKTTNANLVSYFVRTLVAEAEWRRNVAQYFVHVSVVDSTSAINSVTQNICYNFTKYSPIYRINSIKKISKLK